MADKDGDGPSLELPSLGFGRKRGKKARLPEDDAPVAPEATSDTTTPGASEPEVTTPEPAPVAPELEGDPSAPEATDHPAPAEDTAVVEVEPEPDDTAVVEVEPEPDDTAVVEVEPEYAPEPVTASMPPVREPDPAPPPLFADEVEDRPSRTYTAPVDDHPDDTSTADTATTTEAKPKREFRLPQVSEMTASLLTGAIAGLLLVGLTGAGFRLCELIQGAPSCGKPGFLLLAAIVITVILVGRALLAAWSVPDPGSTSFLAVGLLAVVALLFLVEVLFNWWMIIAIPVLSMLCFALSSWVATVFVESED